MSKHFAQCPSNNSFSDLCMCQPPADQFTSPRAAYYALQTIDMDSVCLLPRIRHIRTYRTADNIVSDLISALIDFVHLLTQLEGGLLLEVLHDTIIAIYSSDRMRELYVDEEFKFITYERIYYKLCALNQKLLFPCSNAKQYFMGSNELSAIIGLTLEAIADTIIECAKPHCSQSPVECQAPLSPCGGMSFSFPSSVAVPVQSILRRRRINPMALASTSCSCASSASACADPTCVMLPSLPLPLPDFLQRTDGHVIYEFPMDDGLAMPVLAREQSHCAHIRYPPPFHIRCSDPEMAELPPLARTSSLCVSAQPNKTAMVDDLFAIVRAQVLVSSAQPDETKNEDLPPLTRALSLCDSAQPNEPEMEDLPALVRAPSLCDSAKPNEAEMEEDSHKRD